MSHVELDQIGKRYGDRWVVRDVTLRIDQGEFLTLLGPSGCGKTTLLSMLAGLTSPDSGSIAVAGLQLSAPGRVVPPERRQMGMVFQDYALWPHLTVFENIAFGLRVRHARAAEVQSRVASALALVGLVDMERRYPSQLSGGQQQRVALARSLVVEPTLLLLDEPLSNLDAKLRERMLAELKAIQRRTQITFVYVTHDQTEAIAVSDRIAVMHEGVMQCCAPPRTLYEQPPNRVVAEFMGVVNLLEGELVAAPIAGGLATARVGEDQRLQIRLQAAATDAGPVVVVVRPEDITLARERSAGANVLVGLVTESTYLGDRMVYRVDAGGYRWRVQTGRGEEYATGETVYVALPPERCVGLAAG